MKEKRKCEKEMGEREGFLDILAEEREDVHHDRGRRKHPPVLRLPRTRTSRRMRQGARPAQIRRTALKARKKRRGGDFS